MSDFLTSPLFQVKTARRRTAGTFKLAMATLFALGAVTLLAAEVMWRTL